MKKLLRFFDRRPILGRIAYGVGVFAGAVLLSLLQLGEEYLPAAPALVAAMPFGAPLAAALAGCVCGYLSFWGFSESLTVIAAAFLLFVERLLFRDVSFREKKWFLPASAAALYFLSEGITMLSMRVSNERLLLFFVRVAFLTLCCGAFEAAMQKSAKKSRAFLALCLLCASCRIELADALTLGSILAAFSAASFLGTQNAAAAAGACGLALFFGGQGTELGCGFLLAAFLCMAVDRDKKLLSAAAELCCTVGFVIFSPQPEPSLAVGAILGCGLFAALPKSLVFPQEAELRAAQQSSLERAAETLQRIGRILQPQPSADRQGQSAAVFDGAAEAVCRSCANWNTCWERNAAQTYDALSGAAVRIFSRGRAERSDFPPSFFDRCVRSEQFLAAIDEAVRQRRLQRRFSRRLSELRTAASEQYGFLARYLQAVAQPQPLLHSMPEYTPEVGFRACGVRSDTVCGDSGRSFSCGEWYYLLLCDGMGTGAAAQSESRTASRLLSELILSGMDALDALRMLGSMYLLRQDGGFSTVDLLQISLVTGEGYLHKWGAAPSYLQSGRKLTRLGRSTPPPGVGPDQSVCIRVSLKRGQTLILTSDGVEDAALAAALEGGRATSARELAAAIVAASGESDDRTAAVLRLHAVKYSVRSEEVEVGS